MLYFHGYTRLLRVSIRLSCTRRGNHSCIHLHQRRFSSSLQTKRQGAGGYLAYLLPSALFLSRFLLLIKDVISARQTSGLCLSRNNDSGGDVNGRRVNAPLITHASAENRGQSDNKLEWGAGGCSALMNSHVCAGYTVR